MRLHGIGQAQRARAQFIQHGVRNIEDRLARSERFAQQQRQHVLLCPRCQRSKMVTGFMEFARIGALKTDLNAHGKTLLFATNSGIYAPGLRPLGLHVQAGRELVGLNHARSGGNFAMLPNGVFWVGGGRSGILESRAYERRRRINTR